jgi:ACS family hexuronate transporter-like MFS transporter
MALSTPTTPAGQTGDDPRDDGPVLRARWLMIGLAFLATVINYLDRQTLSVVAPELSKEFRMSDETYGLILAAFMLAYTVMNGVSGPLLDRLGTRLGYALCMAWWSTAGVLHALARGPVSLGVCRFLLGMGEAGNWPAAVKVVAEWFPKRERAFASGIFNSGAAIGAVVAPPLVAWIVLRLGWPTAFVLVGALGYVWLAGWWFVYETPAHVRREVALRPATPWRLLRTRFLASLTLSKVFLDPVWYFYIFWFPKYLSSVHGLSLAEIGKLAWIPFLSADIGNLLGGWLTGRIIRRGVPVPLARKAAVTVSALLMTAAIPAGFTASVTTAIALISVATFGYTSYSANALAFPADVFPRNMVGSIWGLASLGSGFGGMLCSWLSGRVIDQHGYGPVFVAYGVMPLIAAGIVLFALGPLRPHPAFPAVPAAHDVPGRPGPRIEDRE